MADDKFETVADPFAPTPSKPAEAAGQAKMQGFAPGGANSGAPSSLAGAQAGAAPTPGQAPLTVMAQYLKDLSFESPNLPAILQQGGKVPQGVIKVDMRAQHLGERSYESTLYLRVEARYDDQVAYIAELTYGGVFAVGAGVQPKHVEPLLLIEGSRLMFPFAREIIANAIQQAGFRAMLIQPIDFAGYYRDNLSKRAGSAVPGTTDAG